MNKKAVIFLAITVSMLVLLSIIFIGKEPREPILFSGESASYEERSIDDLIYDADAVVIGKFVSAFPSKWNTPDGKLPDDVTIQTVHNRGLYIYTEYLFEVEIFLKGEQPRPSVIIRTFGGQVGPDIMTIESKETYEIGQPYLLFLNYDPRLAEGDDLGPFLIYHAPAVYMISNGKATSWRDEWDERELRDYIINSPFVSAKSNIPDTPEAKDIMRVVKSAYDAEIEARNSSDLTIYDDIFINDQRFPINSEALELVRSATDNPLLETAGFLDYKKAYYSEVISQNNTFLFDSLWLNFISITINDATATVIFEVAGRKELTLVLVDGNWYVAGARGITNYEDNSLPEVLAPNIVNTIDTQEIIQTIKATYQDFILQFISIDVNSETAVVHLHDGFRALILSLTRIDGKWQMIETK